MKTKDIINLLNSHANYKNVEGMARFGISPYKALGITIPFLRELAKQIGKNHNLALELWNSGIHEAKILAAFIDIPDQVTSKQMDEWVAEFDSWDICDQTCSSLFDKTSFAYCKIAKWTKDKREYVRRAGFVMMAVLAVHDKKAVDQKFLDLLPLVNDYIEDERNYVKKGISWALRQIGKRNNNLLKIVILQAEELKANQSSTARWIGKDVLRELTKKI